MLYGAEVWLLALILVSPLVVLALAWAGNGKFYGSHPTSKRQAVLYRIGLVSTSVIAVVYFGYLGWRICSLYQIEIPLWVMYGVDHGIYLSRALSVVAIMALLLGRGPYRALVLAATLWVSMLVWANRGIIHWA